MFIDPALLNRIKSNDPTLKRLDLNYQQLNASDIQELIRALAVNTTLTTLDVVGNQIGDEGTKALVANTTLTTLKIGDNQIGDEGAKALAANNTLTALKIEYNQIGDEGAKALAANTTLTTLNISGNQIGDEGAKALAANSTLTTLDMDANQIGDEVNEQLRQAIARNNQRIVSRRNQFIQKLLILANDRANTASESLLSCLPKELMLHIIGLMDFHSTESIGKSVQQIKACAEFIFNHASEMKAALAESVRTRQDFKIMEKIIQGKSRFQFFPSLPPITSREIVSVQEESCERPNKKPKTLE